MSTKPEDDSELYKKIVVTLVKYDLPPLGNDICAKELLATFQAAIQQADEANREKRMHQHQSICGCPMCEFHTSAYRLPAHQPKPKEPQA